MTYGLTLGRNLKQWQIWDRASEKLNEMGIPYLPALMLYGQSGCGKTMLARYIAHKAKLPFLRIQFSSLVDSHLGQTQSNLARIFDYVRTAPCVLCFDEIDAVGMARGQKDDVGEMNRVVIAIIHKDKETNRVVFFVDVECQEVHLTVKQAKELAKMLLDAAKE